VRVLGAIMTTWTFHGGYFAASLIMNRKIVASNLWVHNTGDFNLRGELLLGATDIGGVGCLVCRIWYE
jgi:hypothetical protein